MKKILLLITISLLCGTSAFAQQAAQGLARRLLGDKASHFVFVQKAAAADYFILEQVNDKVCITANNDNSMAMGLNYYLKKYAHTHVSWYASQPVELPDSLPRVANKVSHQSSLCLSSALSLNNAMLIPSASFFRSRTHFASAPRHVSSVSDYGRKAR